CRNVRRRRPGHSGGGDGVVVSRPAGYGPGSHGKKHLAERLRDGRLSPVPPVRLKEGAVSIVIQRAVAGGSSGPPGVPLQLTNFFWLFKGRAGAGGGTASPPGAIRARAGPADGRNTRVTCRAAVSRPGNTAGRRRKRRRGRVRAWQGAL